MSKGLSHELKITIRTTGAFVASSPKAPSRIYWISPTNCSRLLTSQIVLGTPGVSATLEVRRDLDRILIVIGNDQRRCRPVQRHGQWYTGPSPED